MRQEDTSEFKGRGPVTSLSPLQPPQAWLQLSTSCAYGRIDVSEAVFTYKTLDQSVKKCLAEQQNDSLHLPTPYNRTHKHCTSSTEANVL